MTWLALSQLSRHSLAPLRGMQTIGAVCSRQAPFRRLGQRRCGTTRKLLLARLVSFEDWDRLRDVYTVIRVTWFEIEDEDDRFNDIGLTFDAESLAPRLLDVIALGREVCLDHLGGTPTSKGLDLVPRRGRRTARRFRQIEHRLSAIVRKTTTNYHSSSSIAPSRSGPQSPGNRSSASSTIASSASILSASVRFSSRSGGVGGPACGAMRRSTL
jgi:hypothetical protein